MTIPETRTSSAAQPAVSTRAKGWVGATYFGEGLPYSLVHQIGSQQYFTAVGIAPELVGLTSLLHLPWNVKFLWAPLVDARANAKRWLVGTLLALAGCAAAMSFFASTVGTSAVIWVLIATAVVAATNDIAIDAYYMRTLDGPRQKALSGLRIGAYRLAMLVGGGPLVVLAGMASFSLAFLVIAFGLAALSLLLAVWLKPDANRTASASTSRVALAAAKSFFARPGIALSLALILSYRAGDALLFAMNAKFLMSLGLDTAARGVINGTFGAAASIAGSLFGSLVITRVGFDRAFTPITLLQALALLMYAALATSSASLPVIAAVVIAEQFVAGIGTAAFLVFLLRLCDGEQKATHFAFASSLMSLAVTAAGSGSGFLYAAVGAPTFFVLAFVAALPGVALSLVVDKR